MPMPGWKDLQYQTETRYYQKLRPLLERLRSRHAEFAQQAQAKDREFYNLLANSLKISDARSVRDLTGEIKSRLGTQHPIHIFVSVFPSANAMCMSRFEYSEEAPDEPVIIVSQHFLNELTHDEQLCVIGHELGHVLFGHAFIPARAVLEFPFKMQDIGPLKADVMKWMICSEVSCDLVGVVACGLRAQPFIDSVLKFSTGLHQAGVAALGEDTLSALALRQFEELVATGQAGALSTHPLTLLRAKIVQETANAPLLRQFKRELSTEELRRYKNDLNKRIDQLVGDVYPEVPSHPSRTDGDVLFEAGLAVVLADGRLDPREVETLLELSSEKRDIRQVLRQVQADVTTQGQSAVIKSLMTRAVKKAAQAGSTPQVVEKLVRQLLLIAGSDGGVEASELRVVRSFSSHFGLHMPHLLRMVANLGLKRI